VCHSQARQHFRFALGKSDLALIEIIGPDRREKNARNVRGLHLGEKGKIAARELHII
jgi:hypothetical protein